MAEEGKSSKRAKAENSEERVDPFVHACADVFHFRLIESVEASKMEEEIAEGGVEFDGEFFHQQFGESESIKGFKNLEVNLWFSAQTYHTWLDIKFTQKKLGADKIEKILAEHFPKGFVRSKADFIAQVTAAASAGLPDLAKLGETAYTVPLASDGACVLIKHFNLSKAPQAIQDLHARFQPLLLFFIDGASLIEVDDMWELLLAVQPTPSGNLVLGVTTLYKFWAYPDTARIRLSQILVLPPYRDAGLGKAMLRVAYDLVRSQGCLDLTMEDPSPELQRVREKTEVEALLATPWVVEQARKCAEATLAGATAWPGPVDDNDQAAGGGPSPGSSLGGGQDENKDVSNILPSAAPEAGKPEPGAVGKQAEGKTPGSSQAASRGGSSGSGAPGNPCSPPHSFLARIRSELKLYISEARIAWEALLFLQPGLWEDPRGRAALQHLVSARLEAAAFAHVGNDAERKRIVPLKTCVQGDDRGFIMMRAVQGAGGAGVAAAAPVGTEAEGEADAAAAPSSSAGTVAVGRLNVVTMSAQEKEEKMVELVEDRMEQLHTLRRLLGVNSRGKSKAGSKRKEQA